MSKPARIVISKTIRFEIFKRDGFTCQYCGKTPPSVILEIDHVDPVAKGGDNDINNLLTACFDCNRGKRAIPLDQLPPTLQNNLDVLREREAQLKAYRLYSKKIEKHFSDDTRSIEAIFRERFPGQSFTDSFRSISIRNFLDQLSADQVRKAMRIACGNVRLREADGVAKYFCGICWKTIRGEGTL